jgi:hypothetical protein
VSNKFLADGNVVWEVMTQELGGKVKKDKNALTMKQLKRGSKKLPELWMPIIDKYVNGLVKNWIPGEQKSTQALVTNVDKKWSSVCYACVEAISDRLDRNPLSEKEMFAGEYFKFQKICLKYVRKEYGNKFLNDVFFGE